MEHYITEIENTTGQNIGNLIKKINKDAEYSNFIISQTDFLIGDINLSTRLYYIRNKFDTQLKCKECGSLLYGAKTFCSNKCSNKFNSKNEEINKRRSEKTREFYKNLSDERKIEIAEKIKNTNIEIYGCECSLHNTEVRKKVEKTWGKNGYTNPNKSKSVRDKIRQTCNVLFGGNAPTSSKEVIETRNKNNYVKYGCDPMQLPETKKKMSDSYFAKTGYFRPMDNPDVVNKVRETFFKNDGLGKHKKGYRYKTIQCESKIFMCQGYEPGYLNILLQSYTDIEIENSVSEMRKLNFLYIDNEKPHIYIPDFFIAKENLIIEVKSLYFLTRGIDCILLKAAAVVSQGYSFMLVYSTDGKTFKKLNYEEIKDFKENLQK